MNNASRIAFCSQNSLNGFSVAAALKAADLNVGTQRRLADKSIYNAGANARKSRVTIACCDNAIAPIGLLANHNDIAISLSVVALRG